MKISEILDKIKLSIELVSPVIIGLTAIWASKDITSQVVFISAGLIYICSYIEEALVIFKK
jgi:hypothetical protein